VNWKNRFSSAVFVIRNTQKRAFKCSKLIRYFIHQSEILDFIQLRKGKKSSADESFAVESHDVLHQIGIFIFQGFPAALLNFLRKCTVYAIIGAVQKTKDGRISDFKQTQMMQDVLCEQLHAKYIIFMFQ
jgi:hypothetical protein